MSGSRVTGWISVHSQITLPLGVISRITWLGDELIKAINDSSWFLDYYRHQWWVGNKKYGADQTDDSVLFVWPLQIWLAMNFIAIKSKPYNFLFLHGLTSKPCHDTHICFICRNLDSRTKMLEDHASQSTYNSRIMTVFHEFFRFKLFLAVNSRITWNPCKNDQWCQCLSPK